MESKTPEPKKTTGAKKEEKSGNTGIIIVLVLSILTNIGLGVGLFINMNKVSEQESIILSLNNEVTQKDAEVLQKTTELEGLQSDLERIREEREKLGLANDSLNNRISTLGATIAQLKKTSKLDGDAKRKLERLIAELRAEVLEKDQQIAVLIGERDSLATGLSEATVEKHRLGDSLRSAASALAYAAILKAENVKVVALRENGKEFEGEELKGSRIDRIKVTFSLADNKAAKRDSKGFYVALTTPKGEVFSDPNNGGGMLTLADGSEILYTMNQALRFDNTNQKLTFTMLKGFNYIEGAYKINIYSEGYHIGEGSFKVK